MESTTAKALKLHHDLREARLDFESNNSSDLYLGVGATVRIRDGDRVRRISTYTTDLTDSQGVAKGIQTNFFENGQLIPGAQTTYRFTEQAVTYGHNPSRENGTFMVGRSREFGKRALYFLNYKIGSLVSRNEMTDVDNRVRHAISQVATYRLMNGAVEISPQKGKRIPVRDFNKCLPGHSNVIHMWNMHRNLSIPPELSLLKSGLRYHIEDFSQGGEYEGRVRIAVAGEWSDFADTTKYPDGPLLRIHSACCFSEKNRSTIDVSHLEHDYALLTERGIPYYDLSLSEHPDETCDCRDQMLASQALIAEEGGIFADFMDQEGRGYGLLNKEEFFYRLYEEEGEEFNTADICDLYDIPSDIRDYTAFARKLYDSGIRQVQVLGNNPRKEAALRAAKLKVIQRNLVVPRAGSLRYMKIKRDKLGHNAIPDDEELEAMVGLTHKK